MRPDLSVAATRYSVDSDLYNEVDSDVTLFFELRFAAPIRHGQRNDLFGALMYLRLTMMEKISFEPTQSCIGPS